MNGTGSPNIGPMGRTNMQALVNLYLTRRGGKEGTLENIRCTASQFAKWWDAQRKAPKNLTRGDVESFLHGPDGMRLDRRSKTQRFVSATTYNRKLIETKQFIAWLVSNEYVTSERVLGPFLGAKKNPGSRPKVRLSLAQITVAVEGCADPWSRWVTAFAFLSLGREGELLNTRMGDFDLTEGRIRWERPKVDDHDDLLPMFDQLQKEYLRWRTFYFAVCPELASDKEYAGVAFAIPARRVLGQGRRVTYYPNRQPRNVGHIIKGAAARALGVPPETLTNQAAHIARRSGARTIYDRFRDSGIDNPLGVVKAMLGHEHEATTEGYIGMDADRARRDQLVGGSKLLNFEETNVVPLRAIEKQA